MPRSSDLDRLIDRSAPMVPELKMLVVLDEEPEFVVLRWLLGAVLLYGSCLTTKRPESVIFARSLAKLVRR